MIHVKPGALVEIRDTGSNSVEAGCRIWYMEFAPSLRVMRFTLQEIDTAIHV